MILVTGGAGFIGSALVYELNRRGHNDIMIVDRLRDGDKWKNLRRLRFATFVHADELFDNPNKIHQITSIYHLGACSATTMKDADYLMRNNVAYSQKLFHHATERQIPIVYASSAATYGAGECGYSDDEKQIHELRPLNPYGFSKHFFDEWVLQRNLRPRVWYGVKFFNVYGPNEYHKGGMRSVVHQAAEQIQDKGRVRLFKSHRDGIAHGEQKRDFVYVKDVVRAMIELVEKDRGAHAGIYNMGTGQARSFNELAHATFSAMGKAPHIDYVDMPEHLHRQYQYFTEANMLKFRTVLPDFRFSSLEDGIKDYVTSHLLAESPYLEVS